MGVGGVSIITKAEWIKATEKQRPKDGDAVWVFNEQIGVRAAVYEDDGKGHMWIPDGSRITHWQPRIVESPA